MTSLLNDDDRELLRRFDSIELVTTIRGMLNCHQCVIRSLSDDQMVRVEACANFFPNPPAAKTGRKTMRPITQLRDMLWKLLQDWPLLGCDNAEKLVQKLEYANSAINQRMV
jgi:hypothetical protein